MGEEIFLLGTDPTLADSDADGMPDGWEIQYGFNPSGIAPSPLCNWTFDGLSSTYFVDETDVNSYGYVNAPQPEYTSVGVHDGGLIFDAACGQYGYIHQNHAEIQLSGDQVSVACWYTRAHDDVGSYSVIVAKGGWQPDYGLVEFGRRMCFQVKLDGVIYETESTSAVETPFGEWCYIVGVYDSSNVNLYINGELKSSVPAQGNIIPNTGVGIFLDATAGELDEVKLYDVALDEDDVAYLMEAGMDPDGDGVSNIEEYEGDANPLVAE